MQVYLENQDKVVASVGIRERARDTFGKSIRLMRENRLTFGEAIGSEGFGLMDRHRLGTVQAELFDQLEQTPSA